MDMPTVLEALGSLHKEIDLWGSNYMAAVEAKEKAVKQEAEMRAAYDQREGYISELEQLLTKERAKVSALSASLKAELSNIFREQETPGSD